MQTQRSIFRSKWCWLLALVAAFALGLWSSRWLNFSALARFEANEETTLVQEQSSNITATTSNNKHVKPALILHVGPGKTATTSLQVDLSSNRECLAHDHYTYGGRYYLHPTQSNGRWKEGPESFSDALEQIRNVFIPVRARKSDSECTLADEHCWKDLLQQIKRMSKNYKESLIFSDEPLALRWTADTAASWRDHLSRHFDLRIVLGYRRLYEWLPSSIYQRNRKRLRDTHWPSHGELSMLDPLWDVLDTWKTLHYTAVDDLIHATSVANLPVALLNLHDPALSMTSQFFCRAVPKADECCAVSLQSPAAVDQSSSSSSSTNTTNTNKQMNTRTNTKVHQLYFDTVTTAAAQKGWIDTDQYTRPQVRKAVQKYFHQQQKENNEWDMYCPSQEQLDQLYAQSLQMERDYVWPLLTKDIRQYMEKAHEETFQQKVESDSFCQLDVKKSLQRFRPVFDEFAKK